MRLRIQSVDPNAVDIDPIIHADPGFAAAKDLATTPTGLIMREAIMNALEAPELPEEKGTRRIILEELEIEGLAPKLAVANSGMGLGPDDLRAITDLSASHAKEMHLRANRGEGIKLASLAFNKLGLIFQSFHNGVGSEVTIIYQPSRERFGRLRYRFKDPDTREIWEDEVNDIGNDIVHPRGLTTGDWTRVIFLGNRPDHNTVIDSYDQNQREPYARFTELLRRYYEIVSPIGMVIDLTVDIRSGLRTGARFETISRIAVLESTSNVNTSRYETVKDERTDIEVIYMHLPKYTPRKQNVIGVRYLGSQTTFGGIIWRNELHDVRKDWPLVARQFGIPGVTGEMCVFVRLPDVYPVRHDRYRLDLLDDKNEPLRLIQFSSLIERLRPEWVKDLVESQQREHWSSNNIDEDLDDVARRLRLMDRILQPVEGRRTEARLVEGQGDEALPTGEATVLDPDAQPDVPGGSGSGAPKGNEAVARSARAELVEMRTVLQRKRPEPFHPRHCWIPRGSAELEELGLADPPLLAC